MLKRLRIIRSCSVAFATIAALLPTGCVLTPPGARQERAKIFEAGQAYAERFERRDLPDLERSPSWLSVLHRAFLANGELESTYFEWRAAMERVDQAAGYPNTNLSLGFEYMFSKERMKSWDRTTLSVGTDPMQNLSLPVKVARAGKVAFDATQAAGERFEAAKFDLQRRVLTSYLDLSLEDEKIRIQTANVTLLKAVSENATARARTGGPQQDLLKAQTELELAENELQSMQAERGSMLAMLNAMLAREPGDSLETPPGLPEARLLRADDATLISVGVSKNPELAGLARQVAGRRDALELARLAYLPDINPLGAVTGSISQSVGAMISVPTTLPQIRAAIREAESMLRSSEAASRQATSDRAASFVGALYLLRNAERESTLFQNRIVPLAEQLVANSRQSYTAGSIELVELIDSQRTLLEVRRTAAEVRIVREKRLAELEALAGVDVETLTDVATHPGAQSPTTGPVPGGVAAPKHR
jgi:outer membrane protein, heavy metal efflux system